MAQPGLVTLFALLISFVVYFIWLCWAFYRRPAKERAYRERLVAYAAADEAAAAAIAARNAMEDDEDYLTDGHNSEYDALDDRRLSIVVPTDQPEAFPRPTDNTREGIELEDLSHLAPPAPEAVPSHLRSRSNASISPLASPGPSTAVDLPAPYEGMIVSPGLSSGFPSPTHSTALEAPPGLAPGLRVRNECPKQKETEALTGLQRMTAEDKWLTIDGDYYKYNAARAQTFKDHKSELRELLQVNACAQIACDDLLKTVAKYLVDNYPLMFEFFNQANGCLAIRNKMTSEFYRLEAPFNVAPMEAAARLVVEDFNVFMKERRTGIWKLQASATLCPSGFNLANQCMGRPLTAVHGPVSGFEFLSDDPVEHIFDRIGVSNPQTRSDFFIQMQHKTPDLARSLFVQRPVDFFPGAVSSLHPENVLVRREKQMFRRLEKSGAILVTVHTELKPLTMMNIEEIEQLDKDIKGLKKAVAEYKGKGLWGNLVLKYCRDRLREL